MANGQTALATLKAELADTIQDIHDAKPAGTCQAHEPMARSMILLLRSAVAQIEAMERRRGLYWLYGIGLLTGNMATIMALFQQFTTP